MSDYDEEDFYEDSMDDGYADGFEDGGGSGMYNEEDFYDEGYDEGYEAGYEDGRRRGGGGGGSQGCYVATCVYGSYDCPQVWTLRRFRDQRLRASCAGRAFVRLYYAVSPSLVERFGSSKWFRKPIRSVLDRLIWRLNREGLESTPYEDR